MHKLYWKSSFVRLEFKVLAVIIIDLFNFDINVSYDGLVSGL